MTSFRIEVTRGPLVESVHRISAAIVDRSGRLIASAGNPELVTYWRSAAKPFQALPLVEDGVMDHFGFGPEELVLACASHSSEPVHLRITDRMLERIGCTEDDLACGPHPVLSPTVAAQVAEQHIELTPRWSNCSGKHAGMLALARHHGWPLEGYEKRGHPVQNRVLDAIARWTGLDAGAIVLGVDGCTTVCFGLPLEAMARAYAALAQGSSDALATVRDAMIRRPELVAGEGRFCTDLMRALPGEVVAKVGADGIQCAAVPSAGIGIALKIEDGSFGLSGMALLGILDHLALQLPASARLPNEALKAWRHIEVHNTRGATVGDIRVAGTLRFHDAA
jgi:L-asparaginase II